MPYLKNRGLSTQKNLLVQAETDIAACLCWQFPPFSSLACRKPYATDKKGKCLLLTPAIPLPCAILYNILSNIRVYWAYQMRIHLQDLIGCTNTTGNCLLFR